MLLFDPEAAPLISWRWTSGASMKVCLLFHTCASVTVSMRVVIVLQLLLVVGLLGSTATQGWPASVPQAAGAEVLGARLMGAHVEADIYVIITPDFDGREIWLRTSMGGLAWESLAAAPVDPMVRAALEPRDNVIMSLAGGDPVCLKVQGAVHGSPGAWSSAKRVEFAEAMSKISWNDTPGKQRLPAQG